MGDDAIAIAVSGKAELGRSPVSLLSSQHHPEKRMESVGSGISADIGTPFWHPDSLRLRHRRENLVDAVCL